MGDFQNIAKVNDVPPGGEPFMVEIEGASILLANLKGEIVAFDAYCSHEHTPLAAGDITSAKVVCVMHGSEFDIRTGKVLNPPAEEDINVYEVKVEGDEVLVLVE